MNTLKSAFKNRFVQISFIAFLITLLLFIFTPPSINELVYKSTLYPYIRIGLNNTLGKLPFPALYILLPLIVSALLYIPIQQLIKKRYTNALVYTLSYTAFLITIFFWIWGFHYNNEILVPQPDIDRYPLKTEVILSSFKSALNLREELNTDSISPFSKSETVQLVKDSGRIWLNKAVELLGDPPSIASNKVINWPRGFIIRWGVVGMYFPFSGEATLDGGLHSIRFPSTTLHEWAHSMGYTNEGDCNLLAYLAAQFSSDPFVRYSAQIERLREEMYFAAIQNPNLYDTLKEQMPQILQNDLINIQQFHARYKGNFSEVGNWVNDQYLKTLSGENGIDEYWLWVIKLHIIEEQHPELFNSRFSPKKP
ncbi:MAG TPA: DUF3810 family protein [Chitinophagales bacterium]|nr:DUF3810 family protein [Chitinophagales bacterium]